MKVATKAQRAAFFRIYNRAPLYAVLTTDRQSIETTSNPPKPGAWPVDYRTFRKTIQAGSDCHMVKWCGMWLGIETDGYVHS